MEQKDNFFRRVWRRATAVGIPELEEIEQFGADGEEAIYRLLRDQFDCVIRNVVIPHKNLYLEKDFLVIHRGVPFVLEIKNWKGRIGCEGENFYQDKTDGTHKVLKSPVGTTKQFISRMKEYYNLTRYVYGMVVFAEPDCELDLPDSMDGILLTPAAKVIPTIKSAVRESEKVFADTLRPESILRCTRFYTLNAEFCKGIVTDEVIPCYTEDGTPAALDPLFLHYMTLDHQPLRMRDRMTVTFINGSSGVFYNHDAILTVQTLDGSCRKIALSRVRNVVF